MQKCDEIRIYQMGIGCRDKVASNRTRYRLLAEIMIIGTEGGSPGGNYV